MPIKNGKKTMVKATKAGNKNGKPKAIAAAIKKSSKPMNRYE